jgi:serine/threonine-protein kinase
MVGPYRITGYLGEGSLAKVFKAYHGVLERFVVLKVLKTSNDLDTYERFRREAQIAAKLDHPNILPTLDFGDSPASGAGYVYSAYKWVEGEMLRIRLRNGAMPPVEAARVLGAAGAALAHAHKHSIAHRDIRPSNILLGKDSNVYLTDFASPPLTASGTAMLGGGEAALLVGMPEYSSPEQARGEPLEAPSDQYSLAVVTFEMLTGSVPFWADSPEDLLHHHLTSLPARPSAINPAVPSALDDVILRALSKRPEQRYADIAGFVRAVQQIIAPPRPPTAPLPHLEPGQLPITSAELRYAQRTVMLEMQSPRETFSLTSRAKYWIGRSEPNTAFKPDVDLAPHQGLERGVSRKHGTLHFDRDQLYYTDMRSSNGSRVNGGRLYPEVPMQLKDGDEICVGKIVFRIYFAS